MSATKQFIGLRYLPVLTIAVRHPYYDQEYCPHITLEPSPACEAMLQQYRLRFKPTPLGGLILGQDPSVVPLPTTKIQWEFYLRLRDTEFLAVTAFPPATEPVEGTFVYLFEYQDGAWKPNTGTPIKRSGLPGVIAILRIDLPISNLQAQAVRLDLQTPDVTWTYYIFTSENYSIPLQIAENGSTISSDAQGPSTDANAIAQRFPGKKLTILEVQSHLKKNYPAWYLVTPNGNGQPQHIADVPALPRPRPGAPAHLILDYSAILK